MIVVNHVKNIITYFQQEEDIYHENIGIVSDFPLEENEKILALLESDKVRQNLRYEFTSKPDKQLCSPSPYDLIIKIPDHIFKAKQGTFKYSFQSQLENIFGTLDIELYTNNNQVKTKNEQFFTTSIGK